MQQLCWAKNKNKKTERNGYHLKVRGQGSDYELIEKKLNFVAKYSALQLFPKNEAGYNTFTHAEFVLLVPYPIPLETVSKSFSTQKLLWKNLPHTHTHTQMTTQALTHHVLTGFQNTPLKKYFYTQLNSKHRSIRICVIMHCTYSHFLSFVMPSCYC